MRRLCCLLSLCVFVLPAFAQPLPSIEEKTATMEKRDGFFPVYWDVAEGKVWLEVRLDEDFLYVSSLPAGLGSNDIGLDRGQLGGEQVVHFERVGPKVMLVMPNLRYRAVDAPPAEQRSVREAFAEGILWGFTATAATDDRLLVDATDFIVRDVHGIVQRLKGSNQGTFSLDKSRSAPYPAMIKGFPDNTEVEARLTFTGDNPGGYVRSVAADPNAVTLRVRHSFVKLPDAGFESRAFHPGSGYFGTSYEDYAVPIGQDMTQRFITRHRLTCAAPPGPDGLCDPVEPIVYYLDAGTPEPVRSALLDGARWWNQAFEAAGFRNGFRVEVMPEDADPMDVRYNVIQWVHRSTRGWSYGSSVNDPRTGEIIKGHVSLGSLRVRQDYLIAEGLLAPYTDANARGLAPENDPMLAMALARIRQLSAHEVGHTLGLAHNFAASVNDRASVMDYPAPFATTADGSISIDEAYAVGIGEWDKAAIRYGYAPVEAGMGEQVLLDSIIAEMRDRNMLYITDRDARPAGAAQPLGNLWDNGEDMVQSLENEMAVRASALGRFGEATIREGEPLATLEEVLVPLYLRHRYQVDATVKLVGGAVYSYATRGDTRPLPQPIPAEMQRAAVDALLATVSPEALRLPSNIRSQIPPRPPGYGPHRELFEGHTGLIFDPYAPAEVAASMVLGLLIHPERATRTIYQHDLDPSLPSLMDVLTRTSETLWEARIPDDPYDAEIQRLVQQVWVDELIGLASNENTAAATRARATQHLRGLQGWVEEHPGGRRDDETIAHRANIFDQVDRFLLRIYRPDERREQLSTPPGSPIGQDAAPGYLLRKQQREALLETWSGDAMCGLSKGL